MSNYKNHPIKGAGFSAINAFMLSCSAVVCKFLAEYFGAIEIIFFRNLFGIPLLVIGFLILRQTLTLKTERPWHHLLRSSIGTVAVIIGVWAISLLPLAEMTILFFTCPMFVIILSAIFLKEKIGIYRISAVIACFIGVIIIASPENDITPLALTTGLLYAFGAAAVDICLRWLGNTENSSTTTFYFLTFGLIATALYLPASNTIQNFEWSWPLLLLLTGLGVSNIIALLAKSQSFRLAEASIIAPITFTMIIWAGLFDYIIWNRIPSLELIIGGTIIIASNLIVIYREEIKKKA